MRKTHVVAVVGLLVLAETASVDLPSTAGGQASIRSQAHAARTVSRSELGDVQAPRAAVGRQAGRLPTRSAGLGAPRLPHDQPTPADEDKSQFP